MEIEKAIRLLSNINCSNEEKEALEEAIKVLKKLLPPLVKCPACGQRFRRYVYEQNTNLYGIVSYESICPHCGELYEWEKCYWR